MWPDDMNSDVQISIIREGTGSGMTFTESIPGFIPPESWVSFCMGLVSTRYPGWTLDQVLEVA